MTDRRHAPSIDQVEIERFARLAADWWDPRGPMAPLHKFNPVRLAYIRDQVAACFDRDPKKLDCLKGLRILGRPPELPATLELLEGANDKERDEIVRAAHAIARRIQDPSRRNDAALAALRATNDTATRRALLQLIGRIGVDSGLVPLVAALEDEDVYWGSALAAAEMIRSGTVGFADHYFYMDHVARVAEESGLRANLTWCVFGLGPEAEMGTDLEGSIEFATRWHGAAGGRIRTVLGPHSPYVCPPDFLRRVAERAAEVGLGIHLHVAESQEQMDNSLARHGLTPVGHLADIGVLDVPTIAAHCIYLTDEDIVILAEKGVSVVQTPACHMKLGMGVTPVPELLGRGGNVALGTDGAGSNDDLDMLKEARLAALMQKNHHRDPVILPGDNVLRLATRGGALAMGFPESGVIAPGHAADLIVFDFDRPHLRPRHNLVANVLYAARGSDVCHVVVDGQVLMRDGELLTLDEERIIHEAERRGWRMVGQDLRQLREYRA